MTQSSLTCKELVELVTEYLEGTLPAAQRMQFEAHLVTCRHCTTYLEQIRQTIGTLGALTEETLSPDIMDDLLDHFRDWRKDTSGE